MNVLLEAINATPKHNAVTLMVASHACVMQAGQEMVCTAQVTKHVHDYPHSMYNLSLLEI